MTATISKYTKKILQRIQHRFQVMTVLQYLKIKNNEMWIATKVGLAKYNRVNETFVNYQFSTNNTEFANSIAKIYEDSQNNLWVSTNQGILQFNRTSNEFKKFDVMKIDNTVAQMVSNTISIYETKKRRAICWFG
ncbi:MAG: hypothetical protein H6613_12800 [Ignavibacteriales bacterium]|nr:hypothetical protein [Ignavibacteriales bacterium]